MKNALINGMKKPLYVYILLFIFTIGASLAVFSSITPPTPDDRDLLILYDQTNPLTETIAFDTFNLLDDAYVEEPYEIELINIENSNDLRQIMGKNAENIVYIFHGTDYGMSIGKNSTSWSTLGIWLTSSPVENHFFMSCYSENDYTNVPNKNVVGFDGFVDGLVAQTAILGQLSKTLLPLNEKAADLAKERVQFIIKNMGGDFLTRLLNPIDILSGEEAASMDTLFGAGLFFEMKEGPAKLKVQGHYYYLGLKYIKKWDSNLGEYLNGWYYHKRGEITIEFGVDPIFTGFKGHIDYYKEYYTGELKMSMGISIYRKFSASFKFGGFSSFSASFKAGFDITLSFIYKNGGYKLNNIIITVYGEGNCHAKATAWWATLYRIDLNFRLYFKFVANLYDFIYRNIRRIRLEVWVGFNVNARIYILGIINYKNSIDRAWCGSSRYISF